MYKQVPTYLPQCYYHIYPRTVWSYHITCVPLLSIIKYSKVISSSFIIKFNIVHLCNKIIWTKSICNQISELRPSTNNATVYQKLISIQLDYRSHDSSVSIALGYRLDDQGSRVRFPEGSGNSSLHPVSRMVLGPTQPPIQWVPGDLSLGVKRLRREADHSPPSRAKVKEWVELYLHSPNTPSWRGAELKHKDNFTFTFTAWLYHVM
jgi:hypothetical protein